MKWLPQTHPSVCSTPSPFPLLWLCAEPSTHRIPRDIPHDILEILGGVKNGARVSAHPDVPHRCVPSVPLVGVKRMQAMHSGIQILLAQANDKMMMIGHQNPIQHAPFVLFHDLVEQVDKMPTRVVIAKDWHSTTAASDDVKRDVDGLSARRARHVSSQPRPTSPR